MSFSEMNNFAQKEESELVGFSIALLDDLIPEAGQALGPSALGYKSCNNKHTFP